jgi:hypothetical protein
VRLIGVLALVLALLLGGAAFIRAYTFEKDPLDYAEGVCPAPPNGVDSHERQACLRSFESKSGLDIVGSQLLGAALSLVVGVVLLIVIRPRSEPFQSAPARGSTTREKASG